jgi:type VI protein secretion system component VasK
MAGASDRGDIPALADAVALLGTLLILFGAFMVSIWLAWLAWETYAWWSGLVFIGAGIALFLLAAVGAWLYTTGIPAARARWHEWRLKRERRARQKQQEQKARVAETPDEDPRGNDG